MENKIKILIVDDLEDNRLVLRGVCRKIEGITLLEASNGEEAVLMCQENTPQIVLMDMMMPQMDGAEATKIIKAHFPEMIVIIVTAMIDREVEEQMIKSGATAYFTKPINREMFFYKIKNYINILGAKEGKNVALPSKKAFNPFSREIRSFKTIFQIETANDMMDLGMWLLSWCNTKSDKLTYLFDVFVSFLYTNLNKSIHDSETTNVIIEESFDDLYISIIMDKPIASDILNTNLDDTIRNNIIIRDNTIYMHLSIPILENRIEQAITPETSTKINEADLKQTYKPIEAIRAISDEEKMLFRKSFEEKTHAREYIKEIGGDVLTEIQELEYIDKEWLIQVDSIRFANSPELLINFANSALAGYIHAINNLFEFSSLALALTSLQAFIQKEANTIIAMEKSTQLSDMLSHLGHDLASWKDHVFLSQDTGDIHYLDSSFFCSCVQLEGIITEKALEDNEEDELELF